MQIFIALLALLAVTEAQGETPSVAELAPQLQRGGYVLFMRHPQTNPDQADVDPLNLENVAAQRQLTDEGRRTAKEVGAALTDLKIPIAQVISSKFYRAQEAAKLLGLGKVTPLIDVSEGGLVVSPNENKRRAAALRKLLTTPPQDGGNVVIVSHKPNLQDAAGKEFGDLGEGEIVVFQPADDGQLHLVARIPAKTWIDATK
jgi:phosphohistidine phosphatase SixA